MTAYFKCRCGRHKLAIQELKSQGYEVVILNEQPSRRLEAESYKTRLPFKVTNGAVERL